MFKKKPIFTKICEHFPSSKALVLKNKKKHDLCCKVAIIDLEISSGHLVDIGIIRVNFAYNRAKILSVDKCYSGQEFPQNISKANIPANIKKAINKNMHFKEKEILDILNKSDFILAHNANNDRKNFNKRFVQNTLDDKWLCSFTGIEWQKYGDSKVALDQLLNNRGYYFDDGERHTAIGDALGLLCLVKHERKLFAEMFKSAIASRPSEVKKK